MITNVADKDGRQISFPDERSKLVSSGWHNDVSVSPFSPAPRFLLLFLTQISFSSKIILQITLY